MTDRVLLTGVSGFIGGHVALALLESGHVVRGSLRNMARDAEVRAGIAQAGGDVGRLETVVLDLTDDHGWREAARGCRYLVHVASPISVRPPEQRSDMVTPAVEGTSRAIAAALEAGVERVVLTSSVAAVSHGHPPERQGAFTEADWSRTEGVDVNAYSESKTRAELEAWSAMEEAGRRADLVAINPAIVLGPLLMADAGVSAVLVKRLLEGVPFLPRMMLNLVDVRDVAALHVAALSAPAAGGRRLLAAAEPISFVELAEALRAACPEFARRIPRLSVPDWLVRLYALFDADARASLGGLRGGRTFDTSPAVEVLGRAFLPARIAAGATARSLVAFGLVHPPGAKKRG